MRKGSNSLNKKRLIVLLCIIAAVILIAVLATANSPKNSTTKYVLKNQIELEEHAVEFAASAYNGENSTYNGWDVTRWADGSMIEFVIGGRGFGSGTSYYGFYYSPDDVPMGFQGVAVEFWESDSGWRWNEDEGDNWQYTERIIDKWYWFEMHF